MCDDQMLVDGFEGDGLARIEHKRVNTDEWKGQQSDAIYRQRQTMKDDSPKTTMRTLNIAPQTKKSLERGDITGQIDIPDMARRLKTAETTRVPCLVVVAGLDMGNVVPIEKDGYILGRDPKSDLHMEDDGISRRHLQVDRLFDGTLLIRDLETTNGTYYQGELVKNAVIRPGEKVLLGRNTIVRFELMDRFDLKYQREMFDSSTRDGLTGVLNRKAIMQKLLSDISFARRHRLPFSFLILDIDHFKVVNDTCGHPIGDEVLVEVAFRIENTIRKEDSLGRYGGEEFVVIAQGTNFPGAKALGERIRQSIVRPPALTADGAGRPVNVTISVGAATVEGGAIVDAKQLVTIADSNLYAAKDNGRNCVVASEIVTGMPPKTNWTPGAEKEIQTPSHFVPRVPVSSPLFPSNPVT